MLFPAITQEAPDEEKSCESAQDHPTRALKQHLETVQFHPNTIADQTIQRIPKKRRNHLEEQEATVVHMGDTSAEGNKGSHMPNRMRDQDSLAPMFCQQPACESYPSSQAQSMSESVHTPVLCQAS